MNRFALLWLICHITTGALLGEGTRELAPNDSLNINGNITHDIAALNLDSPEHNNFASFDNPDPKTRLHIYIDDPAAECIFIGLSPGELNGGQPVDYEYQIKDPNGNIVFGPYLVTAANANAPTWEKASVGPASIYGPSGYTPVVIQSSDLTSQGYTDEGNYYIEFREKESTSGFLINYWDITVANCSAPGIVEKKGRIWSNNWALFAINDLGFPVRPFNGAFYVCAPDPANPGTAFITKVDFNGSGFRPAGFSLAFNSFGVTNTGNVAEDRMSVENANMALPEYEIFLNDPVDLCKTADKGSIDLLGISRCSESDICIQFITTRAGQIDVLLDFDGRDGQYTPGTADRLISQVVNSNQINSSTCLEWDGYDGLGNRISDSINAKIPVNMSYAQGIYHFPIYDAELLTEGLNIQSIRPNGKSPLLYYDDSNISTSNGTGEPKVQLTGCTSPCHKWTTYTDPRESGFGNLNTINTWWFSQQVITESILSLPGYPACQIASVDSICPLDTANISVALTTLPTGSDNIDIIDISWSGPGIISDSTSRDIEVVGGGDYHARYRWSNFPGDTCIGDCSISISEKESNEIHIDTLIQVGDTITLFGEKYFEKGIYEQIRPSIAGCDTIIVINVIIQEAVIRYDLEDCRSLPWDKSNQSYEEFQPAYLKTLTCADLSASNIYRENPDVNMHSCSYGINNSTAMCVGSLDSCEYLPGNERSIVFEVTVDPHPDTAVTLTGISFWESAPERFKWIRGDSGPNNYPTLYGLRVLKNDSVVFVQKDIPTTNDWTEEIFIFDTISAFTISDSSHFRFELLPYCLARDTVMMNAWDIDEVLIYANCNIDNSKNLPSIGGQVKDIHQQPFENAVMRITSMENSGYEASCVTDAKGHYLLPKNPDREELMIEGEYDKDPLRGVGVRDILEILRHLRGTRTISDPYALIAADVNKNKSISLNDAIEIFKLILGLQPSFTNKPSWEIGPTLPMMQVDNPWSFYEDRYITLQGEDRMSENWTAVKTGDVDFSSTRLKHKLVAGRSPSNIKFEIKDKWITAGDLITVPISVKDDVNVLGIQLSVDLSNFVLESYFTRYDEFKDFHVIQNKALNFAWYSLEPLKLSKERDFLTLKLESHRSGYLSDLLSLKESRIPAEIVDQNYDVGKIDLSFIENSASDYNQTGITISPNPFSDVLNFEFDKSIKGPINVEIMSLNGQIIHEVTTVIPTDRRIIITGQDLGNLMGTLIYKVTATDRNIVGKVIRH